MGKLRLRVAVVAIAAVIAGVLGVSAPANAAVIPIANLTATIDCSTLQAGYYHSLHLTGSVSGLPAATQYVAKIRSWTWASTTPPVGDITLTSDATGAVVIDSHISASVVSGAPFAVTLIAGVTRIAAGDAWANTCASGVKPTGSLAADTVCPTRYLDVWGNLVDSSYHVHGTLSGFIPGETYTLTNPGAKADVETAAVADAGGVVAYDFHLAGPLDYTGASIMTSSQDQNLGDTSFTLAEPCAPMKTAFPAIRPAESDVDGNGSSDLLAIDNAGRLLFYPNASWQNAGGLPFTTSQVIGSGWGPQSGIRMEATGDLTGDGYAEIVAIRSDGALVAYYNNMGSNPGRVPYTSATLIGSGWQPFIHFTLGDVNHDGFDDLIAERSDGTYWLYANHFLSNPGHSPFTTGVRIPAPGFENSYGFAAVDANSDGYADLWSYSGWLTPNLSPAGNSQLFGDYLSIKTNSMAAIGSMVPQSGWAVGHYSYSPFPAGVLIANPDGNGTLVYIQELDGSGYGSPRVIGSGWQTIRQIIS